MKKHTVFQTQFSCALPIKKEAFLPLKKLLEQLGLPTAHQSERLDFSVPTLHYCRWFIIDQAKSADGKVVDPLLVFSTSFDGALESHYKDLHERNKALLSKIYSHCQNYTVEENDVNGQLSFLKKHRRKEGVLWIAKKGGTVEMIKQEDRLRNFIQAHLDQITKQEDLRTWPIRRLYEHIRQAVGQREEFKELLTPEPKPSFAWKFTHYTNLVLIIIGALIALPFLLVFLILWIPFLRILEIRDNKNFKPIERKNLDEVLEYEDRVFQNQLTIYGALKKPNWVRMLNLRLFFLFARFNGKYRATKGTLSGIATIHFVSWITFNKGKNAVFMSNYDGGWESYLSEFIDLAASVMNISFGNLLGYPKMRWIIKEGAHQEQDFKNVVRQFQYPCQVWHSAYPMISIKNVLNNSKIRQGLSQTPKSDKEIKQWLSLL